MVPLLSFIKFVRIQSPLSLLTSNTNSFSIVRELCKNCCLAGNEAGYARESRVYQEIEPPEGAQVAENRVFEIYPPVHDAGVPLQNCGCAFCALQAAAAAAGGALVRCQTAGDSLDEQVTYTTIPVYQYSSVPVTLSSPTEGEYREMADEDMKDATVPSSKYSAASERNLATGQPSELGARDKKTSSVSRIAERAGSHDRTSLQGQSLPNRQAFSDVHIRSVLYDVFGDAYVPEPPELTGEQLTVFEDGKQTMAVPSFKNERLFREPESSPPDEAFGASFEADQPFDDHLRPAYSSDEKFTRELIDTDKELNELLVRALQRGDPTAHDVSANYGLLTPEPAGSQAELGRRQTTQRAASLSAMNGQHRVSSVPKVSSQQRVSQRLSNMMAKANSRQEVGMGTSSVADKSGSFERVVPQPIELHGERITAFGDEIVYTDVEMLFFGDPNYVPGEPFGQTFQQHEPFDAQLQPEYLFGEKTFMDEAGTSHERFIEETLVKGEF
jgi:hypothetical protein